MGKVPIVSIGLVALKDLLSRDAAMAGCSALEQERRAETFYVNFSLTEKKTLPMDCKASLIFPLLPRKSCYGEAGARA